MANAWHGWGCAMFGFLRRLRSPPTRPAPPFAVIQDDLVVASFPQEQKEAAIEIAVVLARATGRDTSVYETAPTSTEAPAVGEKADPLQLGWAWVFLAHATMRRRASGVL